MTQPRAAAALVSHSDPLHTESLSQPQSCSDLFSTACTHSESLWPITTPHQLPEWLRQTDMDNNKKHGFRDKTTGYDTGASLLKLNG